MRGSDFVDLGLEHGPRWLARIVVFAVAVLMMLGVTAPFTGHVNDKAAGYTELFEHVFADITARFATVQPRLPGHITGTKQLSWREFLR